jgi:hypothetical protein
MRKNGEVLKRGVFDLEVRRKPQAFAADAVSLWRINQKHACNQLFSQKQQLPMKRTHRAHILLVWHNRAFAAPAASFLPATRK